MAVIREQLGGVAHAVLFYDQDADLIRSVSRFVSENLNSGGRAIVIATPEHVASIEQAVGREELVRLDAAGTLDLFMVDGAPDPARFDAIIGDTIRRLAANGTPVAAFGEMVALLWEQGNVTGALRVEELWNELLAEVGFSLFCAYPTAVVGDEIEDICNLHSDVSSTGGQVHLDCSMSKESPREIRELIALTLRQWDVSYLRDDVCLAATELATNAIIHAGDSEGFSFDMSLRDEVARIAITDSSHLLPISPAEPSQGPGGRGLMLIEAIASNWGVEMLPSGKTVWAEFNAPREAR